MKIYYKNLLVLLIIVGFSIEASAHTDRNVYKIYITAENEILVRGQIFELKDLKNGVKEFITDYDESSYTNAEVKTKEIKYIGKTLVSKGVISIQCKRNTRYQFYLEVYNEVEKAFEEVRNESSIEIFGKPYNQLESKYKKSINEKVPRKVSEAEPNYIWKDGKLIKND